MGGTKHNSSIPFLTPSPSTRRFARALRFNSALDWNTARVVTMQATFYQAAVFAGAGLVDWNVGSCTDFVSFAHGALAFDADLAGWDLRRCTTAVSDADHAEHLTALDQL